MYKRACTVFHQVFQFIWDIIVQCKIHLELFRFIHKDILDFHDVIKKHLDQNDYIFDGMDITDKDVITRIEEKKSRNKDDENENFKRIESDDNKVQRKTRAKN